MKDGVNELVLKRETWGDNFDKKLGEVISTIMAEGNVCRVNAEDCGIVVIEFDHDNNFDDLGGNYLVWLNEEETEAIETMRCDDEDEED